MSDPLPEDHPGRWLGTGVDPALLRSVTIELVGMKEIARLLDVPRTTASMWHVRRETTGFPSPVAMLDMGPVFDMAEIRTWYAERYPDRKEPS